MFKGRKAGRRRSESPFPHLDGRTAHGRNAARYLSRFAIALGHARWQDAPPPLLAYLRRAAMICAMADRLELEVVSAPQVPTRLLTELTRYQFASARLLKEFAKPAPEIASALASPRSDLDTILARARLPERSGLADSSQADAKASVGTEAEA